MNEVLDISHFLFNELTARGLSVSKRIHPTSVFFTINQNGKTVANIRVMPEEKILDYNYWKYYQIGTMKTARKFLNEFPGSN